MDRESLKKIVNHTNFINEGCELIIDEILSLHKKEMDRVLDSLRVGEYEVKSIGFIGRPPAIVEIANAKNELGKEINAKIDAITQTLKEADK